LASAAGASAPGDLLDQLTGAAMNVLPRIVDLAGDIQGVGFYLCAKKEERQTRTGGTFLSLTLRDRTGEVRATMFDDVEKYQREFAEEDFVKVEARTRTYQGRLELLVSRIRRVQPDVDRAQGFSEEDCLPVSPRGVDEMWQELEDRIAAVRDAGVQALLRRVVADHGERLRVWPAAQTVHHAYRSGLLEHILQVAAVAHGLAQAYGADPDIVFAGAVLHDIGKLYEIDYARVGSYSFEGNLVGHIPLGLMLVREAAAGLSSLSARTRTLVEHLVASHHGSLEFGSPVEPKTIEAFILAAADDLDAKIHQVRRAIAEDGTDGEFTGYHRRLERVLLKPEGGASDG
jgi:3'-5' exoribonuclease